MGKLTSIEAARGVAAVIVVFYHAARHMKEDIGYMPLGGVFQFGHSGVDFFFVLSGFIIFLIHADDVGRPDRLRNYTERRFVRIFPFYWVILAAALGMLALSSYVAYPPSGKITENIFLLPDPTPIVGVTWSLQFEIIFYAIFAMAILKGALGLLVFALWAGLIVASTIGVLGRSDFALLAILQSSFNLEFFMGLSAAAILRRFRLRSPIGILFAGVAGFLGFGSMENWGDFYGYGHASRFAYGLSAMLIVLGLVELERTGGMAVPGFLTELGRASYSIYLVHVLVIGVTYKIAEISGVLEKLPPGIMYVSLVLTAVASGVIVSRAIEYPMMNLCRAGLRRMAKRQPAPTLPA